MSLDSCLRPYVDPAGAKGREIAAEIGYKLPPRKSPTQGHKAFPAVTKDNAPIDELVVCGWDNIASFFGISTRSILRRRTELVMAGAVFFIHRSGRLFACALPANLILWQESLVSGDTTTPAKMARCTVKGFEQLDSPEERREQDGE